MKEKNGKGEGPAGGKRASIRLPAAAVIALALIVSNLICLPEIRDEIGLRRYRAQAMYHPSFLEEGAYPDLFLRRFVAGRTVRVAAEERTYDSYETYGHDEDDGNPFDRNYLIDSDYTRWFRQFAKAVETDGALPSGEETAALMEPHRGDFLGMGHANDMLRYAFPLNREHVQQASAFWYSWYYHTYAERRERERGDENAFPNIYVNLSEDTGDGMLVGIWDENENLYLMDEAYYRDIAPEGENG